MTPWILLERALAFEGGDPVLHALRINALSNIALASLHLEDYARGLRAAETALKEIQEPRSAKEMVSRAFLETNYARLLLEVNHVGKAIERCAITKRFAAQSHSARAEIATAIAEGLCEVHAGKADVSISGLTATLEKARLLRPMLRDTLAALVKSFEFLGEPQRAPVYLREIMKAARQVQQENALKHLNLHLDQIGVALGEAKSGSVLFDVVRRLLGAGCGAGIVSVQNRDAGAARRYCGLRDDRPVSTLIGLANCRHFSLPSMAATTVPRS